MSVGGKIVQTYRVDDRKMWINAVDEGGEPTAIFVDPYYGGVDIEPTLGDKIWWQQGRAHWTPQVGPDEEPITIPLVKIGCSGVNHPLGKEYEIKYDLSKILEQKKEALALATSILQEWISATPTERSGEFCPINQPQAYKAALAIPVLKGTKKWLRKETDEKLSELNREPSQAF